MLTKGILTATAIVAVLGASHPQNQADTDVSFSAGVSNPTGIPWTARNGPALRVVANGQTLDGVTIASPPLSLTAVFLFDVSESMPSSTASPGVADAVSDVTLPGDRIGIRAIPAQRLPRASARASW